MTKYRMEIEIIGLPKTSNTHYSKWYVAASERKKWRTKSKQAAWHLRPVSPLKSYRLTCVRHSSAQPDFDNLAISFKSVVDGLKDAGIVEDDKAEYCLERYYKWEKTPPRGGKITIIVEEL